MCVVSRLNAHAVDTRITAKRERVSSPVSGSMGEVQMLNRIQTVMQAVACSIALLLSGNALAQSPASSDSFRGLPPAGADMTEVEKVMGPPRQMIPPVGEPPITRWVYDDYTVYFEYDRMIHAVSNTKR